MKLASNEFIASLRHSYLVGPPPFPFMCRSSRARTTSVTATAEIDMQHDRRKQNHWLLGADVLTRAGRTAR